MRKAAVRILRVVVQELARVVAHELLDMLDIAAALEHSSSAVHKAASTGAISSTALLPTRG